MKKVTSLMVIMLAIALPVVLLAQSPGNFATSLHATRAGKVTWYGAANGGFEALTGVDMSQLGCVKCHPGTYADGTTVDAATYQPGCNDCHNFTAGNTVADDICVKCHSRQGNEKKLGYADVHRDKGFTCTTCHSKAEMHGTGTAYNSMLETGAMEVSCEKCHPNVAANTSHTIHQGKLECETCHVKSVISCYNCHLESQVQGHVKRPYGPLREFILMLNNEKTGKVDVGNFQTATYNGKSFVAIAPFTPHTITKEGRACSDCHNSAILQQYGQTGKIAVAQWDATQSKIVNTTGVIPVPPDWKEALQFDFVDYTGDATSATTDPTKCVFLKSTADGKQMLYAKPLSSEQLAKLGLVSSVDESNSKVPTEFAMAQNYPNPFNPGTIIVFQLPKATSVTLKVFNLLGAEVRSLLVNQRVETGIHKVALEAHDLPAGVYIYQIITPEFKQERKLTILK